MSATAEHMVSIADSSAGGNQTDSQVAELSAVPAIQRGRQPVLPTPSAEMSATWAEASEGFELNLRAHDRARGTISNRRCSFRIMARHATYAGLDPETVTDKWMTKYLIDQREDRRGNGFTSLFEDLRGFWLWWTAESGKPNPMADFPRPRTVIEQTHVLTPNELNDILATSAGRDFQDLRNRAMLLTFMDSGLRRFELAALDLDDVDLKGEVRQGRPQAGVHHRGRDGRGNLALPEVPAAARA